MSGVLCTLLKAKVVHSFGEGFSLHNGMLG